MKKTLFTMMLCASAFLSLANGGDPGKDHVAKAKQAPATWCTASATEPTDCFNGVTSTVTLCSETIPSGMLCVHAYIQASQQSQSEANFWSAVEAVFGLC